MIQMSSVGSDQGACWQYVCWLLPTVVANGQWLGSDQGACWQYVC